MKQSRINSMLTILLWSFCCFYMCVLRLCFWMNLISHFLHLDNIWRFCCFFMCIHMYRIWIYLTLHHLRFECYFVIQGEIPLKQSERKQILTTTFLEIFGFCMCPHVVLLYQSYIAPFASRFVFCHKERDIFEAV